MHRCFFSFESFLSRALGIKTGHTHLVMKLESCRMEKVVILGFENTGLLALGDRSNLFLCITGFEINQSQIAFAVGDGLTSPHLNSPDPFADMADAKVGVSDVYPLIGVKSVEFCQSAVLPKRIIASQMPTVQIAESLFCTRINANQTAVRCR